MKKISLGNGVPEVPEIGLGCMRITGLGSAKAARELIDTAMNHGISFFDHADIYAQGEAERIFGEAVDSSLRERMIVQTKCGIRPGVCYDFSKQHILASADASLKRLKTDYIDLFLLHRPDTLMEPEEVAEAFDTLERQGKVRYFGVSNQNVGQIELLNHYCGNKIIVNQLQLSIAHCDMIDSGLNVNVHSGAGIDQDGGILEYCRLKKITIQAWSPFQYNKRFVYVNPTTAPIDNFHFRHPLLLSRCALRSFTLLCVLLPCQAGTFCGSTGEHFANLYSALIAAKKNRPSTVLLHDTTSLSFRPSWSGTPT